ncbi:MAG: N-acetylmuramoyl-L-alanine amidase [Defluviitaleaceae bacterium]|nr:N-acetylmuramoyl-L-alanine amidase [Defluviitaleaceae bacterium]
MKKLLLAIILFLTVILITLPLIRANMARIRPSEVYYDITIILDAGHGGKDGGASSKEGLIERDLVLSITQMVEENLRLQGFNVIMTRSDNQDLASEYASNRKREDLANRVKILNSNENAIAVSIHANATTHTRWHGAQVFYDAKSLENKEFATHIMTAMRNNIKGLTREQRPISNIYILRHSQIPTALVEVGFLSHPEEARLLSDEAYQQLIAYAIFEGILSYIEFTEQHEQSELIEPQLEKD